MASRRRSIDEIFASAGLADRQLERARMRGDRDAEGARQLSGTLLGLGELGVKALSTVQERDNAAAQAKREAEAAAAKEKTRVSERNEDREDAAGKGRAERELQTARYKAETANKEADNKRLSDAEAQRIDEGKNKLTKTRLDEMLSQRVTEEMGAKRDPSKVAGEFMGVVDEGTANAMVAAEVAKQKEAADKLKNEGEDRLLNRDLTRSQINRNNRPPQVDPLIAAIRLAHLDKLREPPVKSAAQLNFLSKTGEADAMEDKLAALSKAEEAGDFIEGLGPIDARVGDMTRYVGLGEDSVAGKAKYADVTAEKIHDLLGAAQTDGEFDRIRGMIPSPRDPDAERAFKAKNLSEEFKRQRRAIEARTGMASPKPPASSGSGVTRRGDATPDFVDDEDPFADVR